MANANATTRRAILKAAPALSLVGAVPAAATQPNRTAALVAEWKEANEAWRAAVRKPGGENFDSPECLHWEERQDWLEDEIKATPLAGPQDTLALIEFGRINYASSSGEWVDLPVWVLDLLQGQARALIGA